MATEPTPPQHPPTVPTPTGPITLSNSIRMTGRQWVGIALFTALFALFAPSLWELVEDFPLEPDYRVPRDLKQDYWLYQRFARLAAAEYDGFVVGDSVVWGVYSKRPETLSHYLNKQAGGERFVNFGMIGCHPLALEGLIRHYASSISGKNVVLQCNLLWLKSPKEDYQEYDDKAPEAPETLFHIGLIPQFVPDVPRYRKQEISRRLSILVEQRLPVSQWANHLQQAYYRQESIPTWTMEHPYADPVKPLTQGLPPSDNSLENLQKPWFENSRVKVTRPFLAASTLGLLFSPVQQRPILASSGLIGLSSIALEPEGGVISEPWIDMDTSLQWAAFRRVVKLLQSRDNRVFVVVGPFNEHMLKPASKERCQQVKGVIETWLKANAVPHTIAQILPSKDYGDPSHPLPAGYELLAQRLWDNTDFRAAMKGLTK